MKKTDSKVILKVDEWKLERVSGRLNMVNTVNELATDDVFQMVIWAEKLKNLDIDDIWQIRLTNDDKTNAMAANLIYFLTGDDKAWKRNFIWQHEWKDLNVLFLEWFEPKIKDIVKRSKTLGDLRKKLKTKIGSEDFYEFGLKFDLLIHE
jgi:hypothetical protein